jgi:hypothetical protein
MALMKVSWSVRDLLEQTMTKPHDVGAVVNAGGPPDRAKLVAVMSSYGLVPAAPRG